MNTVKHIAGEMIEGVQYCLICGQVLCDYRGAVSPEKGWVPQGWPDGFIYVRGNMTSTSPLSEIVEDCSPDNF